MKTLHIFDSKDYELCWNKILREAVRAVIISNGKIAMVKSRNQGFYKFPGGGIKASETHIQALIREATEETGLQLYEASIKELGMITEIRKGKLGREIFEQNSYYYTAEVKPEIIAQNLDEYEREFEFELAWVSINHAYEVNKKLAEEGKHSFLQREAYVLGELLKAAKKSL